MKQAFSFMEVIIATSLLSVIMLALLQIKSDNVFLVSKSQEKELLKDYLASVISFDRNEKNEKVRLDDIYFFDKDEIRKELKKIKIKIKDKKVSSQTIFKSDELNINSLIFEREYSLDNKIAKKIYTFKLEI